MFHQFPPFPAVRRADPASASRKPAFTTIIVHEPNGLSTYKADIVDNRGNVVHIE
jgi:hypothetical protein